HRLDQMIARLRTEGAPASLTDLAPRPVAREANAAAYLQQIAPDLKDFDAQYSASALLMSLDEHKPLNAEQVLAMKAILQAHPAILPTIAKAAECEHYASLVDYSQPARQFLDATLDVAQGFRRPARFIGWKMAVLTAEGDADEAVRLGVQMLRITRLYDE